MRDCFPSGHTEIALVVLLYAWRFERRYFCGLLPAVGLLLFSTVYLRYHYVVDVLAGALLLFQNALLNLVGTHEEGRGGGDRDAGRRSKRRGGGQGRIRRFVGQSQD